MSTILAILSIFKIRLFGSFISSDIWLLTLIRKKAIPIWLMRILLFLGIQLALSLLFRNVQDLLFNLRFGLILLLAYLFSLRLPNLKLIGIGVILLYFFLVPSRNIYFENIKSVLAITPLLFLPHNGIERKHWLTLAIIPVLAIYFDSRALLIGYSVFFVLSLYRLNHLFLMPILSFGAFGFYFFFDALVSEQWYSNLIRLNMIIEGASVDSFYTFLFGMGYTDWRGALESTLDGIGIFQKNLETLNPHFLFVEMIIEWGWFGFAAFLGVFSKSVMRITMHPLGVSLITSCIFTTNTGIERLFLAIGIGILWSQKV